MKENKKKRFKSNSRTGKFYRDSKKGKHQSSRKTASAQSTTGVVVIELYLDCHMLGSCEGSILSGRPCHSRCPSALSSQSFQLPFTVFPEPRGGVML